MGRLSMQFSQGGLCWLITNGLKISENGK